jgi:CRP-like cAMP-binding protein
MPSLYLRSDAFQAVTPPAFPKNHILLQLPERERETLLFEAEYVRLPVGRTVARPGDDISWAYFPESGVVSLVSEMTTGHQVAVAAVGPEGIVGVGALLGVPRLSHRLLILVESTGYRVSAGRLRDLFEQSAVLRRITLTHVGRKISELITTAACYRVHSTRQRLARWLLIVTDKSAQPWLRVTHDMLAQMVGGPRHAVTVALNELRAFGAVAHVRGRVDIVNRSMLVTQACECYARRRDVVGE